MSKEKIVFLLIILIIAGFLRLWQLSSIPPGIWPDEAAYAIDAIETLETDNFRVFYPENQGREGLFMWLLAFSFYIFGISIWSFKIVPAITGILTVFGTYLLTKELFKKEVTALLASFFLAISFWHINFSRIGFRAILLPLFLTFSFYFFFRGFRKRKITDFLIAGLIFGLGFYTYISFRLAVLVLAFTLVFWLFMAQREKWSVKYLISSGLFLLTVFVVALPLGLYFWENPEHFVSRALGVSVFETEKPLNEFSKSFLKHLAMFNFAGDRNFRHNLSGFPQLSPLTGIFFILGIIFAVWRLFWGSFYEKGIYLFLFIWIFALLLPGALTIEGVPHALRTIGVIPAVYILVALGATFIYEWSKNKLTNVNVITLIILVLMTISSFIMYFVVWAKNPEIENAFTLRFVDVGKELNKLPIETKKYVITNEGELPTKVSKFIQKTKKRSDAIYISPQKIENIKFSPGDFVFLMNKEINFLDPVREKFPNGTLYEKERIWIYEIR